MVVPGTGAQRSVPKGRHSVKEGSTLPGAQPKAGLTLPIRVYRLVYQGHCRSDKLLHRAVKTSFPRSLRARSSAPGANTKRWVNLRALGLKRSRRLSSKIREAPPTSESWGSHWHRDRNECPTDARRAYSGTPAMWCGCTRRDLRLLVCGGDLRWSGF